jgi:hypothetical protein
MTLTRVMLRCSPGLVRAGLEARTAAELPVFLDHPWRLDTPAPPDDVAKRDRPPGQARISKRLAWRHGA